MTHLFFRIKLKFIKHNFIIAIVLEFLYYPTSLEMLFTSSACLFVSIPEEPVVHLRVLRSNIYSCYLCISQLVLICSHHCI